MQLNILTPTATLIANEEVQEVIVPAFKGELCILPGHAPLVSTLETGVLRYKLTGESQYTDVVISWGFLQVGPTSVNIMSETAEDPYMIDLKQLNHTITETEKKLAAGDITLAEMEKYQRKLKRVQFRKEMGEKVQ